MAGETQVELNLGDHVVQFYDDDRELMATAGGHLAAALRAGDAAVVVATPQHQSGLAEALRSAGIDVAGALHRGELIVADAASTLNQLMIDGAPDPAAFDDVVGGLVRTAGQTSRNVRAYGEMVALLWEAGFVAAAIAVEELWNDLGRRELFSLFCSYPAQPVTGHEHADALRSVCHAHSAVIGAPPAVSAATERFECSSIAPRQARHFVATTLRGWHRHGMLDDAAVVITELATNAVVHARSNFVVTITPGDDGVVRLVVADGSPVAPAPGRADPGATSGRGLALVAALTTRWGHDVRGSGKEVWAELAG